MLATDDMSRVAQPGAPRTGPQQQYVDKLRSIVKPGTRWLDIGCGRKVAPEWALSSDEQKAAFGNAMLIGIDVDAALTEHPLLKGKAFALGDDLPFRSSSFDVVSANMVMEHVRDPNRVLQEVYRVLRPGGVFVFHTPNYAYPPIFVSSLVPQSIKERIIWLIERRHESDVFPTLYRINSAGSVRKLATKAGFTVSELRHNAPSRVFLWWAPVLRNIEASMNRLLTRPWAERFRSNLLVVLSKGGEPAPL